MELIIDFPGGRRVDAHFGPHTVETDQSLQDGGLDSAPSPFATFLASIGACAGYYVLYFCEKRDLPTQDIRIIQRIHPNPDKPHMVDNIELEIQVSPVFPEKLYPALVRAANKCLIKQHFETPPQFNVYTKAVEIA